MSDEHDCAVAIIGMAGRFPGAPDIDTFWRNLVGGVCSVSFFGADELRAAGLPDALVAHPDFVPARAILSDATDFDAGFFRMSPREAQITDPQHRLFLECAWAALEDGALDPGRFDGSIGVFGGCSANTYMLNNLMADPEVTDALGGITAVLGSDKDHLATRVSYKLDLRGPSITVQTACSTSLVALQLAWQSLLAYQCDAALAGGVSVAAPIRGGHLHRAGDILSADGYCRAFDAQATGTVSGDGVGLVLLRRLEDALEDGDPIRAVLLGAATNNDGAQKVGYTAPSVEGQAEAIIMAQGLADVEPETIGLVEAHGTGTALGDPVEVAALAQAFGDLPARSVALGSVKTNVGHLNSAAGVCGLVKTVLALQHATLPPSLHFSAPNPEIDFEATPFYVNTEARPWPGDRPRAAVSSFGAGGTNAHAVLEPAPEAAPTPDDGAARLLLLSARSQSALNERTSALAAWLDEHPATLADVAFTLSCGRQPMPCRCAAVVGSMAEARELAANPDAPEWAHGRAGAGRRRVVFAFPAQGHQQVGMGRALYEADPLFRGEMDRCRDRVTDRLGLDLWAHLFPDDAAGDSCLDDQRYAGPALFAIGWSLAQTWIARGVRPDAVIGHSTGEYVAAAVAGVASFEDAFDLFMERARLMATLPDGAVLHVPLPAEEAARYLVPESWLALVNSRYSSVVTGTPSAVDRVAASLLADGVEARRVRVSVPAHCPLLEPIAEPLADVAARIGLRVPEVPMISGLTGAPLTDDEATDPRYWVRHLLGTVRFDRALEDLLGADDVVVLELGPAGCMSGLIRLNAPETPVVASLPEPTHPAFADPDAAARQLLRAQGWLWAEGGPAPLPSAGRRVHLPTYPFQRQRYWIDAVPGRGAALANVGGLAEGASAEAPRGRRRHPRPDLDVPFVAPRDENETALAAICGDLLGIEAVGVHDGFFALGGDSLITLRLIARVESELGQTLPPVAAFRGLTVAEMAKHMGAAPVVPVSDDDEGILVALRVTGDRPPLFLPPPAAGVIFPYFELARELGPDRPVYCMQARGLDGATKPDLTVHDMAQRYVRVMRRVQPEGPYYLGGYSFACYIILEMAHILEAQGQRAAHLCLIDEVAPIDGNRPRISHAVRLTMGRSGRTFWHHAHDLAWLGTARAMREAPGPVRRRIPKAMRERWLRFVRRSAMAELIPNDSHVLALDQPAVAGMGELFFLHIYETYAYGPPPWSGTGTLFKSDWWYDRPFFDRGHREEQLGWEQLVTGGVDVRRGAGDHLAIMRQPHVKVLARANTEALLAAEARERRGR